jgi:hypothetical protein
MASSDVCVSRQLIEAYEEVRDVVLSAQERTSSFFSRVCALLGTGGMAKFIACSSEVFSVRSPAVAEYACGSRPVFAMNVETHCELAQVLLEVALTNVRAELRI